MQCECGSQFLYPLSDGTESLIEAVDQIDIRCPSCGLVTSESTLPFRDGDNIKNGQAL